MVLSSSNGNVTLFFYSGVIHESIFPHTLQQKWSGGKEAQIYTRDIRFQGSIPIRSWGECLLAAVYLINRMSSSVWQGLSPYKVFHKIAPKLDHLRTIGYLCYATKLVK